MDAREVTKDLKITGPAQCTALENLSVGVGIRMEGDFPHSVGNLPVLHKALPHKTAAQVFCHQHTNPHVDPDHFSMWACSCFSSLALFARLDASRFSTGAIRSGQEKRGLCLPLGV